MSQTIRRELRLKFMPIISTLFEDGIDMEVIERLADELADAALEVRGIAKVQLPAGSGLDWLLAAGADQKELAEVVTKEQKSKEVTDAFERTLNFNPLPWGTKPQWERLQRFLSEKYAEDPGAFERYKAWRNGEGKYEAMQNKQIYDNPDKFIACWPWKAIPETEQRKPGVGFYG